VLRICSAYDDVKLTNINNLQQHASQKAVSASITDKLRAETEAYFNGFLKNWNQNIYRCMYGERVKEDQLAYSFEMGSV
jgi:hypothetical protein